MTKRLAVLAFLGGLLAVLVPTTHAQSDKAEPTKFGRPATPPQPTRKLYSLRHADPAATAAIIQKHFGDRGVVSETSQGLLVTSFAQGDEIAALIEQLDRPQRQVSVVVTLAEVTSKDQLMELKEAPDQLLAKLEDMSKTGQATLKRITLTGAEGQPVMTQSGGNRPSFTSSTTTGGGGFGGKGGQGGPPQPVVQRGVNYRPLSTSVNMTARVLPGDAVAVDLAVQDSGLKASAEEGLPESTETLNLTTRITVPPGKAVLAQAAQSKEKTSRTILVVVTARADAGPK